MGVNDIIEKLNEGIAKVTLYLKEERPGLIIMLFHSLFKDREEMESNALAPQRAITVPQLRKLIHYFLEIRYQFITPPQLQNQLSVKGKYIMLTFDDGYYNNHRVIPVLEEFNIPALFFITTNNVAQQKNYWWEIVHHQRKKQSQSISSISKEINKLKSYHYKDIDKYIIKEFGEEAYQPHASLSRPFTVDELKDFAQNKLIHIGNHTADHPQLTYCTRNEIKDQIEKAQQFLKDNLNITPTSFAYPFGTYTERVLNITKETGINYGFTVDHKKNYFPLHSLNQMLKLHRFTFSGRKLDTLSQVKAIRSDFRINRIS